MTLLKITWLPWRLTRWLPPSNAAEWESASDGTGTRKLGEADILSMDIFDKLSTDGLHALTSPRATDGFLSRVWQLRSKILLLPLVTKLLRLKSDIWFKASVDWPRSVSAVTDMDLDIRMGLSRKTRSDSCRMPIESRDDALGLAVSRSQLLLVEDAARPDRHTHYRYQHWLLLREHVLARECVVWEYNNVLIVLV